MTNSERPEFPAEAEVRLSRLPGVVRVRTNVVCCGRGRLIVFVGLEERGTDILRFRRVPRGTARLAEDIVKAGKEYSKALESAATPQRTIRIDRPWPLL